MFSYEISESTFQGLLGLQNKMAESYAALQSYTPDEKLSIHRYARISMVGASTRIENALLTDTEIGWIDTILTADGRTTAFSANRQLIENKLSKDRERSIEEVAGCRDMLFLIYEQAKELFPLTETSIRGLHQVLLQYDGEAQRYAGQYKSVPNSVVEQNHQLGTQRTVFRTSDPGPLTDTAMREWVIWYNETLPMEAYPIAVNAELVFRFLAIHPFQDGNGRLGRGLFLLSLLQSPQVQISGLAPYLAIDRHIERHKQEYYLVLNRCSNGQFESDPRRYKTEYFLQFMIKIVAEALDDIPLYRRRFQAVRELSESATHVLDCFKEHPEIRLQTASLVQFTQLPRRTINACLDSLLENGLIQRLGQGRSTRYQLVF